MTDEAKPEPDEGRCVPCDIAWYVLVALGALGVAFMAWDVFTNGQATELVTGLFRKVSPKLAVVKPIRSDDGELGAS